ncbi:hypothetical protein BRADI_1g42277v3 [Brachypodium distachyon]|uniref:Uncharacterized protein n=1 Tax=Brachypodium distachyon TaxID=15368 RepID=A0A2K2DNV9_BRADI|nr:hypothetical protein BRADI_1g42277v3 [Brachypodium distachyon]
MLSVLRGLRRRRESESPWLSMTAGRRPPQLPHRRSYANTKVRDLQGGGRRRTEGRARSLSGSGRTEACATTEQRILGRRWLSSVVPRCTDGWALLSVLSSKRTQLRNQGAEYIRPQTW